MTRSRLLSHTNAGTRACQNSCDWCTLPCVPSADVGLRRKSSSFWKPQASIPCTFHVSHAPPAGPQTRPQLSRYNRTMPQLCSARCPAFEYVLASSQRARLLSSHWIASKTCAILSLTADANKRPACPPQFRNARRLGSLLRTVLGVLQTGDILNTLTTALPFMTSLVD